MCHIILYTIYCDKNLSYDISYWRCNCEMTCLVMHSNVDILREPRNNTKHGGRPKSHMERLRGIVNSEKRASTASATSQI